MTEALHEALPNVEIVATDLNQPMLDVAAERVASDHVGFVLADAQDLPFDADSFDLVVCQFGAMFFPDKVRGHAEARRVLNDGGHYLLAIWDRIERNRLSDVAQRMLIELFPDDPPLFIREGPFGYADPLAIESDLHEAGFGTVDIETVELRSRSPSAHDAAMAFCYGTPMGIESRGPRARKPRARLRGGRAGVRGNSRPPMASMNADGGAHRHRHEVSLPSASAALRWANGEL